MANKTRTTLIRNFFLLFVFYFEIVYIHFLFFKIVVEMSASSPSQAKEQDDDTKPLWTYVSKIKSVGGGGNYEIKCKA